MTDVQRLNLGLVNRLHRELFVVRPWDEKDVVRCIHCDRVFYAYEARVVADLDVDEATGNSERFTLVLCKFPDCDGTLIDFFPARRSELSVKGAS